MQNSCENFQTVHNPRARTCKVCAGIYDIDSAAVRSGNRVETSKSPDQCIIAAGSTNVISAKGKHDDLWTHIQDLLPINLG